MTGANPFDGELTATLVMIFVPTVLAQIWLLYRVWVVRRLGQVWGPRKGELTFGPLRRSRKATC